MSGTLYIKRVGDNLELSTSSTFIPLITTTSITANGQDEYSELVTQWNTNGSGTTTQFTSLYSGFQVNVDKDVVTLGLSNIRIHDSNDNLDEIDLTLNTDNTNTVYTIVNMNSLNFFILTDQDSTTPADRIHFKVQINATLYIRRPNSSQFHLEIADNPSYTNGIDAVSIAFNGDSNSVYSDYDTTWGSGVDTDLSGFLSGFKIFIDENVYNSFAIKAIRFRDNNDDVQTITLNTSGSTTTVADSSITTPFFILTDNDTLTPATRIHYHITQLCVAPFTKIPKIVEIKDVAVGDIIRTSRGDLPIAHIMKTQTTNNKEYVKFKKGCLGPNLPSDDFYVTEQHPLSLGFYKNELLNEGQYDDKEDDYIMLQMAAGELVGRLPGITKVKRDFGHYYNLVFDEHTSIDMEGIDVCSHHPRTGPFFLPREKYIDSLKIDEKKIDKKITDPKFIRFNDLLIRHKPKDIDLKEFLASCLTSDLNKKRQLIN